MMIKSKGKFSQRKLKPVPKDCPFCKKKSILSYQETGILKNYLSERGKIFGKDKTGLCSKHQRQVSRDIKRARFLGLLPFTVAVK